MSGLPRHDDRFDDDRDRDGRRGAGRPTVLGMIGFILSAVSLALYIVVVILYFALEMEDRQQPNPQRGRIMLYFFAFLDVAGFFTALAALIFSARGLSPSNTLYRGWSVTGLVLSIVEIVLSFILGFTLCCWGLKLAIGGAG